MSKVSFARELFVNSSKSNYLRFIIGDRNKSAVEQALSFRFGRTQICLLPAVSNWYIHPVSASGCIGSI
jgi:hypothetical protein